MNAFWLILFIILFIITAFIIKAIENRDLFITGGKDHAISDTNVLKTRVDNTNSYMHDSIHKLLIENIGSHEISTIYESSKKDNILDRIHGSGKKKINKPADKTLTESVVKQYEIGKPSFSWYKYNLWSELRNDEIEWHNYYTDRVGRFNNFLFDWSKVFKEVMPHVHNETIEYMGVIRVDPKDNKTLYVHEMEGSHGDDEKISESYSRSVSPKIVEKYTKIPGQFLFHTHPSQVSNPFPSDADLMLALQLSLDGYYTGHVVIGNYGAIIYYLNENRFVEIMKEGNLLAFYTYCYDVGMAWNSIHSMTRNKLKDYPDLLAKFGITMIIIPSPTYIRDNFYLWNHDILVDRFIKTKYSYLDHIRDTVIDYEHKEIK
jgi:hypothetical protein